MIRLSLTDVLVLSAIAVLHFLYAQLTVVPVVRPDEAGYLMNAAALAGYRSDVALPYFAGYSLFLVPAFWSGWPLESVYLLVKVINTAFFTGTFVLLYALVTHLRSSEARGQILMAVFVVSVYPAFLIYNALAFSENAFIFFFVLSAFVALRLETKSVGTWILFGASVGILFMVHPKSLPVLGAALLVGGYVAWRQRSYANWVILAITIGVFMLLAQGLNEHARDLLALHSGAKVEHSYPTMAQKVGHLIDPVGVAHFFGNLTGQTLYLIVGTAGISVFGLLLVLRQLREGHDGFRHVWAYLALALVGTILMSAAANAQPGRLDHVLYGRYNEGVLAPFLVLGLLSVSRRVRPWLWILVTAFALAMALFLFLQIYPKEVSAFVSITALYFFFFFFEKWGIFNPLVLVAVLAAVAGLWLLMTRISPARFYPIAFAVFGSTSALFGFDLLFLESRVAELATHDVVGYITTQVPEGTCINHDAGSQSTGKIYPYKIRLYKYPLLRLRSDDPGSLCSEWLLSDSGEIESRFPGARLVAAEEHTVSRLWRLPGGGLSDPPKL